MNSIFLIGHLTESPQYYTTNQGADLTKFKLRTLADRRKWSTGNSLQSPEHQCIAWGPAAIQLHEFLEKGSRLAIRGELYYAHFTDRSGHPQSRAEVYVSDFTFLGQHSNSTA